MKGAGAGAAWIALLAVLAVRAVMAGSLPITADEAYYWLWSRYPDFGYLDHPPMIAWLIRAGTLLFGDTVFGIRFSGVVLSGPATFFVWKSAVVLLGDSSRAAAAALLFNLTLMANVELLAATPDMPSIVTSAALLFCLARLQQTGHGQWWLWVGLAAGLGLLSKYSALFLIAGAFFWLLLSPKAARWLKTPWPWMGAVLALLVFLPNLLWQAAHDWETFVFQFARVPGHQVTSRFLVEFLGAQLGMASPFMFLLGAWGLARARRAHDLFLPAMLIWPGLLYFFIHALHDRVQGNWPSFLYPAFSILAVSAFAASGWRNWCARLAAPVAGLVLLVTYAQALTGFIPLGARDPLARLLGKGFAPLAGGLAAAAKDVHAGAVLTTDYETTAWLRFYQPGLRVLQLGEAYRYPQAPMPDAALLRQPLLYFVTRRRDQHAILEKYFAAVSPAAQLSISRQGLEVERYQIYLVQTQKAPITGRMP